MGVADDTVDIIADWDPEVLTVQSWAAQSWAEGRAIHSWATHSSFTGDWQPASGRTVRAEVGMKVKSDAFVIAPTTAEAVEGHRIRRADGTFMYVNYVRPFKGHKTIMLTKTEGDQ